MYVSYSIYFVVSQKSAKIYLRKLYWKFRRSFFQIVIEGLALCVSAVCQTLQFHGSAILSFLVTGNLKYAELGWPSLA